MTLGGATIVVAYTLFAVLLALVVVVGAAWTQLDRRRGDDDRTGRALAAAMPRLEAAGARSRSLAEAATERARARLVRRPAGESSRGARPAGKSLRGAAAAGLDAVARGASSLSGRLASQRAADPTAALAAAPPARRGAGARVEGGRSWRAPRAADRPGAGAPGERAGERTGERTPGAPVEDGRDRLPASFRDRLVS
ncbi:hypothetical protein [uncultured Pseudokineococcus sp.]|uniref:hypothetical protein n=1 Tax=uncultured Pseudokineococcus sp. TaxID=1642928 RepID=UPI00261ECFF0|nr:hypothetical protein [uncultured Pseudokineococcus sp.]